MKNRTLSIPGVEAERKCLNADGRCGNTPAAPAGLAASPPPPPGKSFGGRLGMQDLLARRDLPSGFNMGGAASAGTGFVQEPSSPRGSRPTEIPGRDRGAGAPVDSPELGDRIQELSPGEAGEEAGAGNDARDSEAAKKLVSEAMDLLRDRKWSEAIELLNRAIKADPSNPSAWLYRAMARNFTGDYAGAEKDAKRAVELDPNNAEAWEALAWAQLKQGKYEAALESASQAIRLKPEGALGYAIRAYAREMLGDREGMLADIGKAASRDKRFEEQYRRGVKGERVYDPDLDIVPFMLPQGSRSMRAAAGAGLGLLGLALGAALWAYRRNRFGWLKDSLALARAGTGL